MKGFKKFVQVELRKYKRRGMFSVAALILLCFYFTHLPLLAFYYYQQFTGYSKYQVYVVGSFVVHLVVYLSANSVFFMLYYLQIPFFENWKVTKDPWPWKTDPEFYEKLKRVLYCWMFNQVCIVIPVSGINGLRVGFDTNTQQFPSLVKNFCQIIFFIVAEDFMFYWSHRILHYGNFYKWVHKQHHEFNMTICVASEYAHPVEFLIGNIFPLGFGPFLLGQSNVHIVTWFLWLTFRVIHTSEGHSGYEIPFSPFRFLPFGVSSKFHDDHHLKNIGNYGSMLTLWDSLCGTNQELKEKKDF